MPAENGSPESIVSTVSEVTDRVTVLIREEIELAKAEVAQKVSSLARGAAAVAVGAVFGVFALVMGLFTLGYGLDSALNSIWIGFLIVFGVLLLATIGAFLFAWRKLKVGAPTPQMAIDEAKRIRETVGSKPEAEVVRSSPGAS